MTGNKMATPMESINIMQADPRPWHRRLWTRLGFGECAAPDPWPEEIPGMAPGRMTTHVIMHFDWRDRLRLLCTGRAMASVSNKTDVIVHKSLSASSVSVLPPGWKP